MAFSSCGKASLPTLLAIGTFPSNDLVASWAKQPFYRGSTHLICTQHTEEQVYFDTSFLKASRGTCVTISLSGGCWKTVLDFSKSCANGGHFHLLILCCDEAVHGNLSQSQAISNTVA